MIGSICAKNHQNRSYFIKYGLITKLTSLISNYLTSDALNNKIIWVVCNLVGSIVHENSHFFNEIIVPISEYLRINVSNLKQESIRQITFIIFKLTQTRIETNIEKFVNSSVYETLVQVIDKFDKPLKFYIFRIFANFCSGSNNKKQRLINKGILDLYIQNLEETNYGIQREIIRGIINISYDTDSQLDRIFNIGLIEKVLQILDKLLADIGDYEILPLIRECYFLICIIITNNHHKFQKYLSKSQHINIHSYLIQGLQSKLNKDLIMLEMLLESIRLYLQYDIENSTDFFKNLYLKLGIEEILLPLLSHPNENINFFVEKLINDHFK